MRCDGCFDETLRSAYKKRNQSEKKKEHFKAIKGNKLIINQRET